VGLLYTVCPSRTFYPPSNQINERTKSPRATRSAALPSYHYSLSVRRLLVSQTTHRCRRDEEDKYNQPPCPSTTLRRWPRCHRHRTLWILSSLELSVRLQQWCILGTRLRGFVVSSELEVFHLLEIYVVILLDIIMLTTFLSSSICKLKHA